MDERVTKWTRVRTEVLTPRMPFEEHVRLFESIYADWPESNGPPPAWVPTGEEAARTNIAALIKSQGFKDYRELHRWSVTDRAGFWSWAVEKLGIRFQKPPSTILDDSKGAEHPRWLPGAELNIVESCFQADDNDPAIVFQSAGGDLKRIRTKDLRRWVHRIANCLLVAGFKPGDAIAIDMVMTPEAVQIYLGIVLAGMSVVSIADSMAPAEIATRLKIADAKGIFTVGEIRRGTRSLPMYAKVVEADAPRTVVLDPGDAKLRDGDLTWEKFLEGSVADRFDAVVRGPEHVTNILFSSGTTGDPKAIPWTQLTPIKAAIDGTLHLDVQPGDVVAWPTNLGWMMGPWLIYASLLNRATIALYTDAPTPKEFGRFVQDAGVTMLGLVPSIVKAWRTDDRMVGFDWSSIKCFGSTGEASNAGDYLYLMMLAGYRPVIEYCGGTEIGGGYLTGTLVQPQSPATFSTPALGLDLALLDPDGNETENGEVFLVPPSIGLSQTLLNRDHHKTYFDGTPRGLRRHGDQIERLAGGYYRAHGRVDDTMNLGGIKTSSADIERVCDPVEGVQRTAAIAVSPEGGGPSRLVIYAVPDGEVDAATVRARLQQAIKTKLNPLFKIEDLVLIDALPVTASNKVMRRELRAQYKAR